MKFSLKLAEESKNAAMNTDNKIDIIITKIQETITSIDGISVSNESQAASMKEISATANKLDKLKHSLLEETSP